jgi:hypothetical protein
MAYVGNCINSFDVETGSCSLSEFVDVSDFAVQDETAVEISKQEFDSYVNTTGCFDEYYRYQSGLLVSYEYAKDIHYFFRRDK